MTTVVLVHGTGVREPALTALHHRVADGLARVAPHVRLVVYDWGSRHGATLAADGISVPTPHGRARGALDSDEDAVAAWELLYADPFAELRIAASQAVEEFDVPPHTQPPDAELRTRLEELLRRANELEAELELSAYGAHIGAALTALLHSPLPGRAAHAAGTSDLAQLVARAVVALALSAATDADDPLPATGSVRDSAVAALTHELGGRPDGSERGPKRFALRAVTPIASRAVVRRRAALTRATHPAAGDVLRYLARGDGHRSGLADLISQLPAPVVLLCHSLGGIIAVDTLVTHPLQQVRLLATVGSQAPFLYETGALPSLTHPAPLPSSFPRWLNYYDPRDLLGFAAGPLFPGRATDVVIDNGQPFPLAHSAYWTNPRLYTVLAASLP
ncbi:hypothetical protein [Streptomyces sp. KL116D]|uniref:hypothetical protein n=1 Tax=Streptomyces sp. KL116D TaxID=3045152 RepID=UPI003556FE7C